MSIPQNNVYTKELKKSIKLMTIKLLQFNVHSERRKAIIWF